MTDFLLMWDKNLPIVQIFYKFESSVGKRLFQEWVVGGRFYCTQDAFYKVKVISAKEIPSQNGS